MIAFGFFILSCVLSAWGCATFNPVEYKRAFEDIKVHADKHSENEEYPQALILYRSLLDAEPANDGINTKVKELLKAEPGLSRLLSKKMLGSNLTDRIPNKQMGLAGKIFLYVPNRIFDIMDILTLQVGLSFGAGAGFKATEFVSAGAQISGGEAVIGLDRRHISTRATIEDFVEIFPVEARAFLESKAYSGGAYSMRYTNAGTKNPGNFIFQRARDFWAVSASAEALFLAARCEFHTVELWDFFAGWAMFDPLNDDMGTTKKIKLSAQERNAILRLAAQVRTRGPNAK
jgi:hypothetical protein